MSAKITITIDNLTAVPMKACTTVTAGADTVTCLLALGPEYKFAQ